MANPTPHQLALFISFRLAREVLTELQASNATGSGVTELRQILARAIDGYPVDASNV